MQGRSVLFPGCQGGYKYSPTNQSLYSLVQQGLKGGQTCSAAESVLWARGIKFAKQRVSGTLPKITLETAIRGKSLDRQDQTMESLDSFGLSSSALRVLAKGESGLTKHSQHLLRACYVHALTSAKCLAWIISFLFNNNFMGKVQQFLVLLIRKLSLRNTKKLA